MATLTMSAARWRMLRRAIKKKRFSFADTRSHARNDQSDFDWLLDNGFVTRVGEESYELTEKGRGAADLGEYNWEPSAPAPAAPDPDKKSKKPKKK